MKHLNLSIRFAFTFAFLLICCFAAQAQQRVFVSGLGDDLNPCTRTSPCRNFQRGHDAVAAGGEVVALDSAGYGQVTITKSVTITGDSVYAGITASTGNGVTIATAGITVNLRSLTIDGLGSGDRGIQATHFSALHIENCIVNRFANDGIRVQATVTGATSKVFIKDSISRNNLTGIYLINGGGTALIATVEGTRTENNGTAGITSGGPGAIVTARGCVSSGNTTSGFLADGGVLNIESSVASNNNLDGIENNGGGTISVSNSTVTNNASFGFFNSSGTFNTRENNTVAGNNGGGAQTSGTITPLTGT